MTSFLANGYVRSEAVVAIYIQKKSRARRGYASILHIKTNTDGFKNNGLNFPCSVSLTELLDEMLTESGVDRREVTYVEAHGTGTQAGDMREIDTLNTILSKSLEGRETPLLIGSVKSNMGHAEGAAGLCSIAKIMIMCQDRSIPANLHYESPQQSMKTIKSGLVQVGRGENEQFLVFD
jgi:fatty acid synthase